MVAQPQPKRETKVTGTNGDKRLTDHRLTELERRATGLEEDLKEGLEKANAEITEVKGTVNGIDKNVVRLVERMEAEKAFRARQIDLDDTAARAVVVQAPTPPAPASETLTVPKALGIGGSAGMIIFALLYIILQLVST